MQFLNSGFFYVLDGFIKFFAIRSANVKAKLFFMSVVYNKFICFVNENLTYCMG